MPERQPYDRVLALGLVVLLLVIGGITLRRAAYGLFDFHHFYLDARYVWEHGQLNPDVDGTDVDKRRQLPFYLPVVSLLLAPVAALGRTGAALVWSAAQVAALGYSLNILRHWGRDEDTRSGTAVALALAILLALPAFIEAAKFNQLSYFVLALVLGAVRALDRRRPWTTGALLGVAAVLKLLPGVFIPWLLLKRCWSAAAAAVLVAVLGALLPCLLVFGPHKTIEYHRQWWDYNVRGDAAGFMFNPGQPGHLIDHRNQSIAQVLARLTWAEHPFRVSRQPLQQEPQTCMWLGCAIGVALLVALLWSTRRPRRQLGLEREHAEAAAYAMGMLVFSPLLRQYYLVWAVPALVLLARFAVAGGLPRRRRAGYAGLALWVAGMVAWLSPTARACGAHLAMLIALGGLLLWATHERRTSVNSVISGRQLKRT